MRTLFLDIETTGLDFDKDKIVEVATIDQDKTILFHSLINPQRSISPQAEAVHGISESHVKNSPTFAQSWSKIKSIIANQHIVIHSTKFHNFFFPDELSCAAKVTSVVTEFEGTYKKFYSPKRSRLEMALEIIGYDWESDTKGALTSCYAMRALWFWIKENKIKELNKKFIDARGDFKVPSSPVKEKTPIIATIFEGIFNIITGTMKIIFYIVIIYILFLILFNSLLDTLVNLKIIYF